MLCASILGGFGWPSAERRSALERWELDTENDVMRIITWAYVDTLFGL